MRRSRGLEKIDKVDGWSATRQRSGHYKITGPGVLVFTGSTPSDWRSRRNLIGELRRAGAPQDVLDIVRSA